MDPSNARLVRWQVITVGLMVVGYSGIYLCRSNFAVTLPSIEEELIAGGRSPQDARLWMGWIITLGVAAYTVGKFITGSIADFLGGRGNILTGMLGSVLFTLLFAVSGTAPLFTLAWIGNRAVQSLCWTGMVKITGRWFSYSAYGTAMGVVSLSFLFGDAAAHQFMGMLLEAGMHWRGVFFTAAGACSCWPLPIGCGSRKARTRSAPASRPPIRSTFTATRPTATPSPRASARCSCPCSRVPSFWSCACCRSA